MKYKLQKHLMTMLKADYARYENAFKTGGVTKQQLDQQN
jgi:hypothetical protein